jgi:hypothetical protein
MRTDLSKQKGESIYHRKRFNMDMITFLIEGEGLRETVRRAESRWQGLSGCGLGSEAAQRRLGNL